MEFIEKEKYSRLWMLTVIHEFVFSWHFEIRLAYVAIWRRKRKMPVNTSCKRSFSPEWSLGKGASSQQREPHRISPKRKQVLENWMFYHILQLELFLSEKLRNLQLPMLPCMIDQSFSHNALSRPAHHSSLLAYLYLKKVPSNRLNI